MRHIFLICLLVPLFIGCSDNTSISGVYSGGSTTEIRGGDTTVTGAVSMNATIKQQGTNISVQFQSCRVEFESYATGLANAVKNSSCTLDPEIDGGTTFVINKGQATFGDATFGMMLHGVASDKATWDFTFAGVRK